MTTTRCRTFGHAWDEIPTTVKSPDPGMAVITLRCTHCTTVREDHVSIFSGGLYGRRYTYPDGYKGPRQTRDDWRMQYMAETRPKKKRASRRKTA